MEGKIKLNIPQQSIAYIIMCLMGVLIFIFVGILPYQKTLRDLDKDILYKKTQIEQQTTLQPFYRSLVKQAGRQNVWALPMPSPQPLPRGQLGRVAAVLREVAARSGMEMMSVSPELNVLTVDAKSIPVNTVIRGHFMDLRKLLINIGSLPYLENVEQIQIRQVSDMIEFKIRIWLSIA